jgi:hypothetical protein
MNLRQGFLRLWLVFSALWSAFWLCSFLIGPLYYPRPPLTLTDLAIMSLAVLAPWLLTAFGFGIRWIVAGFRLPADRSN